MRDSTPHEPLLSPDWYRVAGLRPQLRPGIAVTQQQVRGEAWHLFTDPASGQHHRFNHAAQQLLGACDGRRTVDAVWTDLVDRLGDAAPTQGEALGLLAQAFGANLMVGDLPPDAAALLQRRQQGQRRRRARLNPLAFQVPLANPDRWLQRLRPHLAWLRSPHLAWALGLAMLASFAGLLWQAEALAGAVRQQWQQGQGRLLLLLWLAYPPVKALHEAAHALMVTVHGGAVREVGLSLMLGQPVPYVDASASQAFANKRHRMAVSAAGIVVELLLAGLALLLWLQLEPGLARDAALAVATVAGLSTLLVNANPLLRFDGYHLLCDAAELPNLAGRSQAHWAWLLKRHGLRLAQARGIEPARGEWPWLLAHAPLAWLLRNTLLLGLATAVASWSAPLGLALLVCTAWLALGRPAFNVLRWLLYSPDNDGQRGQSLALASAAVAVALAGLLAVPLADRTQAPALVWLPDDALVRTGADGELRALLRRDGERVPAGALIAQLDNPELVLRWQQASRQLVRQRIERDAQFEQNAGRLAMAADELNRLAADEARLAQQVQALSVRTAVAGRLVLDHGRLHPGQHLAQGSLLAQVLPDAPPLVRALVPNDRLDQVRAHAGPVTVQLAHADGPPLPARLDHLAPGATRALPSPALGEAAGGPVPLDPADPSGQTAREPHQLVDLRLPAGTPALVGARARVEFDHGQASLASLAWRQLRRAFLRHFER